MTAHTIRTNRPQCIWGGSSPDLPETHQTADAHVHMTGRDVARTLALDISDLSRPLGLGMTPYQHLPLYAKVAIERLDCDDQLRTAAQLDQLLQAYASTYGLTVDLATCAAAHRICAARFACFVPFKGVDRAGV